jgi:hypothetical protein
MKNPELAGDEDEQNGRQAWCGDDAHEEEGGAASAFSGERNMLEVMANSAEHRRASACRQKEGNPGEASGAKILAGTEENTRVTILATYMSVGSANFCVRIEREIGEEDSHRIRMVDDVLNTRDGEARSEGRDRWNRREQRGSRVVAEWREWHKGCRLGISG